MKTIIKKDTEKAKKKKEKKEKRKQQAFIEGKKQKLINDWVSTMAHKGIYNQKYDTFILDNIKYGNLDASLEDVKKACDIVGAPEFIENLEHKYDTMILEECFISCRALGRGIDDVMVHEGIRILLKYFSLQKIKVQFQKGPRNAPAESFVNTWLSGYLNQSAEFFYDKKEDLLTIIEQ